MKYSGQQLVSNHIVLASILNNFSSQELLIHRLVCKIWLAEANRLIRCRQHDFFFSPQTKTRTTGDYNDPKWKRSWDNALQISFIYSPWRDTFIRASRRLIHTTNASIHLEASTLDLEHQQIESDFFRETGDFFHGQTPDTSYYNSKMAGYTIDQFTDFLQLISPSQSIFEDSAQISTVPYLSFRFECGRLWARPEISRFFRFMGPRIQYLTVGRNHMYRLSGSDGSHPWYVDLRGKWDHSYQVFRQLPNLQVLTIVATEERWITHLSHVTPRQLQPLSGQISQGWDEQKGESFLNLKCLRIYGFAGEGVGKWARDIMKKAAKIERVVFEMGFAPCLLPYLSNGKGVDFYFDFLKNATVTPEQGRKWEDNSVTLLFAVPENRLFVPMTTLCLQVLQDSPQLIKYIAQLVILQQQLFDGMQPMKTLHLLLVTMTDSGQEETPSFDCGAGGTRGPYNSSFVAPLLDILKTVSNSLETLSLAGGAGVFLEGLIQMQTQNHRFHGDFQGTSGLKSFPNVRTLFFCVGGTKMLSRRDFLPSIPNFTSTTRTTTTMPRVFPRVQEISLGFYPFSWKTNPVEYESWMSFMARPDLLFNPPGNDGDIPENECQVIVNSVRKVRFGNFFPLKALDVYKFSNVHTLCLECHNFFALAPVIWSLVTVETLLVDRICVSGDEESLAPKLEAALTGLPIEVIKQWTEDLKMSLDQHLSSIKEDQEERPRFSSPFLTDKREAFRSLIRSTAPSIFDLVQLRHLKFIFNIGGLDKMISREFSNPIFSPVGGLFVFDLLPPSTHITFWTRLVRFSMGTLVNKRILEKAFGSAVSSNPRVKLKQVPYDMIMPHAPA